MPPNAVGVNQDEQMIVDNETDDKEPKFGFIEEKEISITNLGPIFNGTYSTIYRGVYRGRSVAVKVLASLRNVSLHAMRRKVYRERTVWGHLDHPNLVRCYGYTEEGNRFGSFGAIVIPWCEHGSLDTFLDERGPQLTKQDRKRLCIEVTHGVNYLHTHDPVIIHGDLKPGNILISERLTAKICDFGLSRVLSEGRESGMTTTSDHTGTDRYLAYELVQSTNATLLSTASDVWALGCIYLNVILHQLPYADIKNNRSGEIFRAIQNGQPPGLPEKQCDDSEITMWNLLRSCWELEPAERPNTSAILEAFQLTDEPKYLPKTDPQAMNPAIDVDIEDNTEVVTSYIEQFCYPYGATPLRPNQVNPSMQPFTGFWSPELQSFNPTALSEMIPSAHLLSSGLDQPYSTTQSAYIIESAIAQYSADTMSGSGFTGAHTTPSTSPMEDPRYHALNHDQLEVYEQIQHDPRTKEILLRIGKKGNVKPSPEEINAFLEITQKPKPKTDKGSRLPVKEYKCRLCDYKPTERYDTIEYHVHGHLGLRTYVCEICGYSLRRPRELKNHEETIHNIKKTPGKHGGRRVPRASPDGAHHFGESSFIHSGDSGSDEVRASEGMQSLMTNRMRLNQALQAVCKQGSWSFQQVNGGWVASFHIDGRLIASSTHVHSSKDDAKEKTALPALQYVIDTYGLSTFNSYGGY